MPIYNEIPPTLFGQVPIPSRFPHVWTAEGEETAGIRHFNTPALGADPFTLEDGSLNSLTSGNFLARIAAINTTTPTTAGQLNLAQQLAAREIEADRGVKGVPAFGAGHSEDPLKRLRRLLR